MCICIFTTAAYWDENYFQPKIFCISSISKYDLHFSAGYSASSFPVTYIYFPIYFSSQSILGFEICYIFQHGSLISLPFLLVYGGSVRVCEFKLETFFLDKKNLLHRLGYLNIQFSRSCVFKLTRQFKRNNSQKI